MAEFTQANRALRVATPLGADVFLLSGLTGREELSRLFEFQLDLLALTSTAVDFDKLLGQVVTATLELPEGGERHLSGIVNRVTQGGAAVGPADLTCTSYRLSIVPKLWMLTLRERSRIFQQLSIPDILTEVLSGIDVDFQIQGTFHPRNYCAQYRESDFNFASRLMEEEGIYYFFQHSNGSHKMVVANTPISHPDLPGETTIRFDAIRGGGREDSRVFAWDKVQELRSGKYTLWDNNFGLPQKNLEASVTTIESVSVGTVDHKLRVGGNDAAEIYDYPGDFAKRFDGVDPGGGARGGDLQKIFEDNQRTVKIRMQEEELGTLATRGGSDCRQMTAGHKFTLDHHDHADGAYVLTSVQHEAHLADVGRSGAGGFHYENHFSCIPAALPFRPGRRAPRPRVQGCQTAIVVGPAGEEIFTDSYGRVKVQFNWDRDGKKDGKSSCWLRVGTPWAGKQWGMVHIPRIGNEVIVDFIDGDPDQPIITGMIYNPDSMPPYALPEHKTRSGIKTRSSTKGTADHFNEIRFEDKKGSEEIYIHAETNMNTVVENSQYLEVGVSKNDPGEQKSVIHGDQDLTIKKGNQTVTIEKGDQTIAVVEGSRTLTVSQDQKTIVEKGDRSVVVDKGNQTHTIDKGDDTTAVKMGNQTVQLDMGNQDIILKMGNRTVKLNLGKISEEAMQGIELKVGQSSVLIDQTGVTIKGMMIKVEGQISTEVKGLMTTVKADAILTAKGSLTMIG